MYQTGLFKAIHYFGTQKKLARAIGVSQQAVSQWLCREQKIPYAQVVKIVDATQSFVTLKELAPEEKTANQAIKRLIERHSSFLVEIPITRIDMGKQCCPIFHRDDNLLKVMSEKECMQPVWIDNYNQLMTCECRVRAQQLKGKKTIMVYIVHLEAVLRGEYTMPIEVMTLPISEKVAVIDALVTAAGQRRGRPRYKEISPKWDELSGRIDILGAKLTGFGSKNTYHRAKHVVTKGIPALIHGMDKDVFSITKAVNICSLLKKEQHHHVQQLLLQARAKNKIDLEERFHVATID